MCEALALTDVIGMECFIHECEEKITVGNHKQQENIFVKQSAATAHPKENILLSPRLGKVLSCTCCRNVIGWGR